MSRLILLAAFALAACGVDGAPQPPSKSGITVSGEARIGVTN
jgi:hypothetical protein